MYDEILGRRRKRKRREMMKISKNREKELIFSLIYNTFHIALGILEI